MKRRRVGAMIGAALLVGVVAFPVHAVGWPRPPLSLNAPDPVGLSGNSDRIIESAEEAAAADLALVAKARGWSEVEVAAYYESQQALERLAVEVALAHPDIFVGSALSKDPYGPPTLYVKGPADESVKAAAEAATVPIIVADDQPYSFEELEERKSRVHHSLLGLGYRDVASSAGIADGGRISVTVAREPGLTEVASEILSFVPAELRSSVDLTVVDGAKVGPEGAFGGMWLLDDGVNECTSGFTVERLSDGVRGISTAAHCTGLNQVNHPGHGVHALTFSGSHTGQWGDTEWHRSVEFEADDFYSDPNVIRDVAAVKIAAGIALNESVCAYGRSSNERHCQLEVTEVSAACGGISRLVRMNGDVQIPGDSGGPWFFGLTAYGVHYGNCGALPFWDYFSPVDYFEEGILVRVVTF